MKIVNRRDFLSLPENTIFAKYEPCFFEEILIKCESLENDFIYQNIVDAIDVNDSGSFSQALTNAEQGESLFMDFFCESRDGMFDENQLFAVFQKEDVIKLIERLSLCL